MLLLDNLTIKLKIHNDLVKKLPDITKKLEKDTITLKDLENSIDVIEHVLSELKFQYADLMRDIPAHLL